MPEEVIEENKEQTQTPEEIIDTYTFFSNPVKVNITLFNGIKLLLSELKRLEEKIDKLTNGNQK